MSGPTTHVYSYDADAPRTVGRRAKFWENGVEIQEAAREQVAEVAKLPFVFRHVAVMPDAHAGLGATIGSVIPTIGAVIPAAVGVDLGCGVAGLKLDAKLDDREIGEVQRLGGLEALRARIEELIPHGRSHHGDPEQDVGAWRGRASSHVAEHWQGLLRELNGRAEGLGMFDDAKTIEVLSRVFERGEGQLGTLGTGNHFVELATDQDGCVWILVHSGSRGPGAALAGLFMRRAKMHCNRWMVPLSNMDLAYLPEGEPDFQRYLATVAWAQRYARTSRSIMLSAAKFAFEEFFAVSEVVEAIDTPHNFIARERHFGKDVIVTRKGACSAGAGERVIVPGAMGAATHVVTGKGERESFGSCSHGAGRAMSRREAMRRFTVEDHAAAVGPLECRRDEGVLDETPAAYKPIAAVMAAQSDLVETTQVLTAFVNVKG